MTSLLVNLRQSSRFRPRPGITNNLSKWRHKITSSGGCCLCTHVVVAADEVFWSVGAVGELDQVRGPPRAARCCGATHLKVSGGHLVQGVRCLLSFTTISNISAVRKTHADITPADCGRLWHVSYLVKLEVGLLLDRAVRLIPRRTRRPETAVGFIPNLEHHLLPRIAIVQVGGHLLNQLSPLAVVVRRGGDALVVRDRPLCISTDNQSRNEYPPKVGVRKKRTVVLVDSHPGMKLNSNMGSSIPIES